MLLKMLSWWGLTLKIAYSVVFWGVFFFRPSRLNLRSKNIKTSLGSVGGRVPSLRKPLDGL